MNNVITSFGHYARYRNPSIVNNDTGWPSRDKYICIAFRDADSPNYPHEVLLELNEDEALIVANQLLSEVAYRRGVARRRRAQDAGRS